LSSALADPLRWQAHYCRLLGSPLYGSLLERAADDVEEGGPTSALLEGHEHDPTGSMLALRLMGAAHRLVLERKAPELERFYPSVGGAADAEAAWPKLRELFVSRRAELRAAIMAPVQTNEVGRSTALAAGFLLVAQRTGLPLRLLEVGASSGLNLLWDRYFYSTGEAAFGPDDSPVRFVDVYEGRRPPFDARAEIAERRGCDTTPLDPCSEKDRITLTAYVWPDQTERLQALRAALPIVCAEGVPIERASAEEWTAARLAEHRPGTATVVFHSLVMQYLRQSARSRFCAAIERAGAEASEEAPLAWLRMEIGGEQADVLLNLWPGGEEELIARAGYHGRPVRWLAG
jgi:hypothetical protein